MKNTKKKWNKFEIDYLRSAYGYISNDEISSHLQRHRQAITLMARKLGLPSTKSFAHIKYHVDHTFFRFPNITNSYIAGLILADGYILPSRNMIRIKLQATDFQYLKKISHLFGDTIPINSYTYGKFSFCSLAITSKGLIIDLYKNFNVSYHQKIFKNLSIPPNLDEDCSLAFICGLIDGDGCICIVKDKYIEVSISSHFKIVEWISDFSKKFTWSNGKNTCKGQGTDLYKFKISKNNCIRFLSRIDSINELHNLRLDRKWNKFYHWMDRRSAA